MKIFLKPLLTASLLWNFYLVVGVILNQNYALTRAAGGQFESFPIGIRVAYVFTLAIVVCQALLLRSNERRPIWVYRTFFFIGIASVFVNTISRSSNERWNAIPAAVIAYCFYLEWKSGKA